MEKKPIQLFDVLLKDSFLKTNDVITPDILNQVSEKKQ
jgi:hypothetical protein